MPKSRNCYLLLLIFTGPSAPINVIARSLSSTSVAVTWDPPMTSNGTVRFYSIKFTSISTGDVKEITTTNTSVIITMLEKFTTYEVQVFANTTAEGEGSDVVTVKTDEDSELQSHWLLIYVHSYNYSMQLQD